MIKDKITPELKNAFIESIDKTKATHREHGFYMCLGKDGKLSPSKDRCEGTTHCITTEIKPDTCPGKIQGFFHAHPKRLQLEMMLNRKLSDKELGFMVSITREGFAKKGFSVQSPSHTDVLNALIDKCEGLTEGTTCTTSDLEGDKIECWTPKKYATNFATCLIAKIDSPLEKGVSGRPKKWIKSLFDKEIVDLK
jgi:hypothetical protein